MANGFTFIIIGLVLLTGPGLLYNNLNNSGLVIAGNQSPSTCDATLDICTYPNNVVNANGTTGAGCQANPNVCQLNGRVISFLNSKSPFTQLLSGNLFALFVNLNPFASSGASQTSWSGTHGPFDITGNPIYYSADCIGNNASSTLGQTTWLPTRCTQTNTDNSNVTKANVVTWNNWNTNWNTSLALMFYQTGNATFKQGCSWIAQINYTLLANGPGYTYWGCSITQGPGSQFPNAPTHRTWGFLVAYPVSYGLMPICKTSQHCTGVHINAFVQLENWYTQQCVNGNKNLGPYTSQQCLNFQQGFKGITLPLFPQNTAFVPNSTGAIIFGFLAGIILLLLGLGLQIGIGGGVSAGVNRQATKFAQVMGIGLILWSFFTSQFATWFSSGILPFGLDGLFGLVGISIDALFFFGVYQAGTTA